jgi:hypothetical protein
MGEYRSMFKRHALAYNSLRDRARKIYSDSGKPKRCIKCGYNKHYHVAHIQGLAICSDETYISIINSIDNLIALCNRCYWELDHHMFSIQDILA